MVCVPAERTRFRFEPFPRPPSMLDAHASEAERLPSCLSVAEPANVTELPLLNEDPFPGDEMLTVGAVFLLVDVGG